MPDKTNTELPGPGGNEFRLSPRQTEELLHLMLKTLENSIEGVVVTDAGGTIKMVNRAFTRITGYQPAEVIGKNPRLLKSDRHDQTFYAELWQRIGQHGQWQGEIWNRRKNGEVYLEFLTITAIRNSEGKISYYIGVFHDLSEIKSHEERLTYQMHHDALTGLPNRMLCLDRLETALTRAKRHEQKLAVLYLDVDNFKRFNESMGHTFGDQLLKELSRRLVAHVREGDTVCRLGGDEFIIILEGLKHEKSASTLIKRLFDCVAQPLHLQGKDYYLSISIGITFFPADGDTAETLIKNADTAMYRAKREGGNRYRIFTRAMNDKVVHRLTLEHSLRRALERQEFLVYYQPKASLRSNRVVGVEALVRWRRSDGSLVSPLDFIPLAEETGLIIPLGDWVLATACRQAAEWRRAGHEVTLSVNLSPRQFRRSKLVEKIDSVLSETDFPGRLLEFEITEATVIEREKRTINILNRLKERGVQVSIDDFGTGYSSLYYLKKLPIDALKIDKMFVMDLPDNEDDRAITSAIISLARNLRLKVIAEGVATVSQLNFLRSRDCDEIQGFLLSRPLPVDKLLDFLNQNSPSLPLLQSS